MVRASQAFPVFNKRKLEKAITVDRGILRITAIAWFKGMIGISLRIVSTRTRVAPNNRISRVSEWIFTRADGRLEDEAIARKERAIRQITLLKNTDPDAP